MSFTHPQNSPFHIEVFIYKNRVKRALVDNGASLNICMLNLVKSLGYTEDIVDPKKRSQSLCMIMKRDPLKAGSSYP